MWDLLISLFRNRVEVTVSPTTVELRCRDRFVSMPALVHLAAGVDPATVVGLGDLLDPSIPSRPISLFLPGGNAESGGASEEHLTQFFRAAFSRLAGAGLFVVRPTVEVHGVSSIAESLGAHPEAVIKSVILSAQAHACEVLD